MPADGVLLGGKCGDDNLGTHQHRDQCSGCPASMPNLARLPRYDTRTGCLGPVAKGSGKVRNGGKGIWGKVS